MCSFTLKISPGIYVTVRRVCYFMYYIFLFVLKLFGCEMSLRRYEREPGVGSPVTARKSWPRRIKFGRRFVYAKYNNILLLILYIYLYTYLIHAISIQTSDIGCTLLSQYIIHIYIYTRDIIKNTYIFI